MFINRFDLNAQGQFISAARHGGQHVLPPATPSADAFMQEFNITLLSTTDSVSRTYFVTISSHRVPGLNNRQIFVAVLAGEQIDYEWLDDVVRGFRVDG